MYHVSRGNRGYLRMGMLTLHKSSLSRHRTISLPLVLEPNRVYSQNVEGTEGKSKHNTACWKGRMRYPAAE